MQKDNLIEIYLDYIDSEGYVQRYDYEKGNYYSTGTCLKGPKGNTGNPGRPGKDGLTPRINQDTGNWMIGDVDTGVTAGEGILSDWNQNDQNARDFIKNKPTKLSDFQNDSGYLTLHQDISDKEDVITIVAPINATDATLPITTLTCETGKYYRIDVAVDTLAVTLPAITDLTTVKTVVIYLTADTTPAITISASDSKDVYYQDGFEIEASKTYEINALFNGAAWVVAAVEIVVPETAEEEKEGGE